MALQIARETYRDKVYGGWLGKQIGGTLGIPVEGRKQTFGLRFYDPVPGQAAANDDLDFQLVWLHALREHGPAVTADDLAAEWLAHIHYRWDELGFAADNLSRGLEPPISGGFDNWFRHATGGMMRADIWAMISPGAPQTAAAYAHRDASIDHAEEGVWAAMFWAAVESAAFAVSSYQELLDVGLAMIPSTCRTARAVRSVRESFLARISMQEARAALLAAVGHDNYTDAPQNSGFITLGLLYGGGDFGSSLCAAVNCGYDTDGNGATLGALLGILKGRSGLPQEWTQPIGDAVILGWGVRDLKVERTTTELTENTVAVGERVIADLGGDVELVDELNGPVAPVDAPVPDDQPAFAPAPDVPGSSFAMPDLSPPTVNSEVATGADAPPANERARFLELDPPAQSSVAPTPEAPTPVVEPTVESIVEPAADLVVTPLGDTPSEAAVVATEGTEATEAGAADGALAAGATEPAPEPVPEPLPEPAVPVIDLRANARVRPLLVQPINTAVRHAGAFEIVVDYGENGPVIIPNAATSFTAAIRNLGSEEFIGHVTLNAPSGWQVAVPGAQGQRQMLAKGGMARFGFVLRVPDTVPINPDNRLQLVLTPESGPATTCDVSLLGGSCWWFVGPLKNFLDEGYDRVSEVEDKPGFENRYLGRGGGLIGWQKMAFRETVMPLEYLFAGTAGVAYGVTTLHAPREMEARIMVHSNDGVRIWLNDQRLLQRHSHDEFRPSLTASPTSADVTLRAGENRLMIKVVRCGEPLKFAFALTDRDGRRLREVSNARW